MGRGADRCICYVTSHMPDKPPNRPPSLSAHMMTDRLVYHQLYHGDRNRGRTGYLIDVSSCNNNSDYYIKEVCAKKKLLSKDVSIMSSRKYLMQQMTISQ